MYSCACRCPQVSATMASHLASWSLDHAQHPPFTTAVDHHVASLRIAHDSARLPRSIGADPHDLHLAVATASELHTCTSQTKRHAPGFEAQTGKPSTRPIWTWHTPPGVTNRSRCVSLIQSLRLDLGSPRSQSPRRLDSSCTVWTAHRLRTVSRPLGPELVLAFTKAVGSHAASLWTRIPPDRISLDRTLTPPSSRGPSADTTTRLHLSCRRKPCCILHLQSAAKRQHEHICSTATFRHWVSHNHAYRKSRHAYAPTNPPKAHVLNNYSSPKTDQGSAMGCDMVRLAPLSSFWRHCHKAPSSCSSID